MNEIYLDNCSTSFPKAPGVGEAMRAYIEDVGVNIARGGYARAYSAAERVLEARERLSGMLGGYGARNVIFTSGATASLNMLLQGLLRPGDHIIVSALEHNAVMRPLRLMDVSVSAIPCFSTGEPDISAVRGLITGKTRAIAAVHASNVCGTVTPLAALAAICREHGLYFIVDAAQTAGVFELNMAETGIDALAFPGHKGLLGPQGIGGFLIRPEMARELRPLLAGGTGSVSDRETMPETLPDKFEPGTANLPGIMGLLAALDYIEKTPPSLPRELELTKLLLDGVAEMGGVRSVGLPGIENRAPVVSLDFENVDNSRAAYMLERNYGVMCRCGLHCAPAAHRALGTFPRGTVRLSPGRATGEADILAVLGALRAVTRGA